MDQQPKNIRQIVLAKIKQGEVRMHSRSYFFWQAATIIAAIVLISLLVVFIASFTLYVIRASGGLFLPNYGLHGWQLFLTGLPWLFIVMVAALILLLEVLIRRFSYRRPFIYSLGGILVAVSLVGGIVGSTELHPLFFKEAQENRLPVAGWFYRWYSDQQPYEVHRGVITDLNGQDFTLIDDDSVYQVTTQTSFSLQNFRNGDEVFVFGEDGNGIVQAIGLQKIDPHSWEAKIHHFDLK